MVKTRQRQRNPKNDMKDLSKIEAAVVAARTDGATLEEAAIAAGLAPYKQAAARVEKRALAKAPEIFESMGISVETLGRKILQKLDAKETKFFHNQGIVMETREVDAHDIQLKAVDLGLRVHGALKRPDDTKGDQKGDSPRFMIDLSFLGPERAKELLEKVNRETDAPARKALRS